MNIARPGIADLRWFDEQFAIADGNAIVRPEHAARYRTPVNMNPVFSARLQPDFPGPDPQLRLIIRRNSILGGDHPVVILRPADPDPIPQRIALGGIKEFSPAAELEETHNGTFLLSRFRLGLRSALIPLTSVKYSAHSSIVQMFFMIFT